MAASEPYLLYDPVFNPAPAGTSSYVSSVTGYELGSSEDVSAVRLAEAKQLPVVSGAVPAVVGGATSLLGALGVSGGALATVTGIGAGVYGLLQALGLGEGGGILGNNLLGGDTSEVNGVTLGGPGLAEPGQNGQVLLKEWHVKYDWGTLQYYLVQTGPRSRKIAMYNTKTGKWKVWPWRKPYLAVIGKNMPRHQMITRLRKNLSRHKTDAKTILKYSDPLAYYRLSGYTVTKRRRR